ncbi:DUF7289 family protein [Salinibaculum rarum]|uniref:DUF7289 family protein n=1 Tax=Salinibaculum rarum TaxID=3058903 RepID=UPI00265D620E|nr:hypothetical protein [Salinibaculum sp. KK48]
MLEDTQQSLAMDRAEIALTQFDSEASLAALDNADTQTITFATGDNGEYHARSETGWLQIRTVTASGSQTPIVNTTLGAVIYESGDETLGYQGGGVWRASAAGGSMISPPEFHYRNRTLTFPVVSVTNNASISGKTTITHQQTTRKFPTAGSHGNPVTDRKIEITVKSRYYRGWGEYFEERTESDVRYNEDRNIVNITLVPPPEPIKIDSGIVAAGNLNIDSGAAGVTGDVELGGTTDSETSISGTVRENVTANQNLTNASAEIVNARQRLQSKSAPSSSTTVEAGTYYVRNDSVFESETTFNTSDGDIELFVDGDVLAGNDNGNTGNNGNKKNDKDTDGCTPGSPNLNVTGDGSVTIYVNGDFSMQGQIVWGNCAQVDSLILYSKDNSRITEFYGVIYTNNFSVQGKGGKKGLVGALVSTADTVELGGNAKIAYHDSLRDTTIQEVEMKFAAISYLHVTHNEIVVE